MTSALRLAPGVLEPTSPVGLPPLPRHRWSVLAVCCTALGLTGLDSTIVTTGLPAIGRSLHAGVTGLQWTSAAYTVTLASLLLFSGAIADRIGRRAVFQAGLSLFVLGSWLCSLAPSLGWLIAFRAMQGAGGSMLNPAALGIITNTFTVPAERARAIGIWDSAFGLSMALGPVVGGLLVSIAGWRGVFWASIPAGLAALTATALLVPDSRAACPRRLDPAGQALVTMMIATLAAAIIDGPGLGWLSPATAALFTLAATMLAGLLAYEQRRAEPLIQVGLFRSASFAVASVTAVCAVAAMAGFLFLTALYLQDARGMSPLHAGLTVLPMPAEIAVCAPLAGRIIARRGSRLTAVAAGAALAVSSAALTRLTTASSPGYLVVTYSLFGMGVGLASPAITYGIMSGIPDAQAGLASAINSSSRQLGQSLGVAVTGTLLTGSLHGPMRSGFVSAAHAAWWAMAGCGLAVLAAGLAAASRPATPAARSPRRVRRPLRAVRGLRGHRYHARHARPR
jgi:EmrB/QacA subfamily drug resistance transporter